MLLTINRFCFLSIATMVFIAGSCSSTQKQNPDGGGPEDDDTDSDDDSAGDDTGTDDTAYSCTGTWQPLGTLTGFDYMIRGLVTRQEPPQLGIVTAGSLLVYELQANDSLSLVLNISSDSEDVRWSSIADTSWGFVVTGYRNCDPCEFFVYSLLDDETLVEQPFQLSGGKLASEDNLVVVAAEDAVTFFDATDATLSLEATVEYTQPQGGPGYVALDAVARTALVTNATGLSLIPVDLGDEVRVVDTTTTPRQPFATPDGWVIPQTSNSWESEFGRLELLDIEAAALTFLAYAPVWSSYGEDDGPFDGLFLKGELFLAHFESGLLRLPWDPNSLDVPVQQAKDSQLWPDYPIFPDQVEHIGDILLMVEGEDRYQVGVVRICEE